LKPGLGVLHSGVIEGRRASANVLKYLFMGTSSNFGNMFSMAAASVFLPFLPMLPTQILPNNFLYDASQLTIPSDNRRRRIYAASTPLGHEAGSQFHAHHWPDQLDLRFSDFSRASAFFSCQPPGISHWFVESLATQTLVIFVIRTVGNPLKSRPSLPLALTTILIVATGISLPHSPFTRLFGFVPLPAPFFVLLAISTVTYLALVELGKRMLRLA
jgi:Mg2+-importing ATPase